MCANVFLACVAHLRSDVRPSFESQGASNELQQISQLNERCTPRRKGRDDRQDGNEKRQRNKQEAMQRQRETTRTTGTMDAETAGVGSRL